jgi:hypothetical protein
MVAVTTSSLVALREVFAGRGRHRNPGLIYPQHSNHLTEALAIDSGYCHGLAQAIGVSVH